MTRLIVVTLLLAVVAIVLKLRNRNTTATRSIKVTSRVTINRGSMLAVVEIDGRRLLIGAAPNQVNLIAELADAPPVDPTDPDPGAGQPTAAAAAISKLSGLLPSGQRNAATRTATPVADEPTNIVDRVRRMTARTVEPKLRLPNQGLPNKTGGAT